MTRDRSGTGFWPAGFWSGFEAAGDRARASIARDARKTGPRPRCAFCGRVKHPDQLREQNILPACLECRESGAGSDPEYLESVQD